MLYLTTCVGLGTGGFDPHVEAFLDKTGSPLNPTKGVPITPHPSCSRVCLGAGHTLRHTQPPVCDSYHFASPLLTRSPTKTDPQTPTTKTHPSFLERNKKGKNTSCGARSLNFWGVLNGCRPVPEYQLVIHRLRLSAWP